MRGGVNSFVFSAFLATAWLTGPSSGAFAARHDGNWSVLIITEKGGCDPAYRYAVNVAGGRVRYVGDASIGLSGTVADSGLVKVNIRHGDQGATGSGRLSAHSGAGTWKGVGANGACAGRWEAERH